MTWPGHSDQVCLIKNPWVSCVPSRYSRDCSLEPSAAEGKGGLALWCQWEVSAGAAMEMLGGGGHPPGGKWAGSGHKGLSRGEPVTQAAPHTSS